MDRSFLPMTCHRATSAAFSLAPLRRVCWRCLEASAVAAAARIGRPTRPSSPAETRAWWRCWRGWDYVVLQLPGTLEELEGFKRAERTKVKAVATRCPQRDAPSVLVSTIMSSFASPFDLLRVPL